MKSEKRFDSLLYGLIPGILLPVATLTAIWFFKYQGGLFNFLKVFQDYGLLAKIVSLSAIPNLGLFFLCIWTNRSVSARGVIFATLIVALVMVVLKIS